MHARRRLLRWCILLNLPNVSACFASAALISCAAAFVMHVTVFAIASTLLDVVNQALSVCRTAFQLDLLGVWVDVVLVPGPIDIVTHLHSEALALLAVKIRTVGDVSRSRR